MQLRNLKKLYLTENRAPFLNGIANLTDSEILHLRNYGFKVFQNEINRLFKLKELKISIKQIKEINLDLQYFDKMQKLERARNDLEKLLLINDLCHLESLDLHYNRLKEINSSIFVFYTSNIWI